MTARTKRSNSLRRATTNSSLESLFQHHFNISCLPSPEEIAHPNELDPLYFPKLGVSVRFLINLVNFCETFFDQLFVDFSPTNSTDLTTTIPFHQFSTTDICEKVIKPLTTRYHLSLCDLLQRCEHPHIGKATVFISHAWKYKFIDVVNALQVHFQDSSLDTIVWFDVVSVNQTSINEKNFAWWSTTFQQAIKDFGHTVMILSPWHDPIPLTRAWCLWELYSTLSMKCKFEVAVSKTDRESMIADLTKDCTGGMDKMRSQIDVARSECYVPRDKEMIFDAIQSTNVSCVDINRVIFQCLQEWVIQTLRNDYQRYVASSNDDGSDISDDILRATKASKAKVLGLAYQTQGLFEDAKPLLELALEEYMKVYGESNEITLHVMCDLASSNRLRNDDSAKRIFERCLELCQTHLGESHATTLLAMNGIAGVYYELDEMEKVKELTERCLDLRKRTLGETHIETLTSMNNLASVYSCMNEPTKALELNQQCYDLCLQSLGHQHPQTLWALHTLAIGYQHTDEESKALELHQACYEKRITILGPNHAETLMSLADVAMSNDRLGNMDKAIELYEQCLQHRRHVYGDTYADTRLNKRNLARAYYTVGKYYKARMLYQELFHVLRNLFGVTHHETLSAMLDVADVFTIEAKYSTAQAMVEECLQLQTATLGECHADTLSTMNTLGDLLCKQKDYANALIIFQQIYERSKATNGEDDETTLLALSNIGVAYLNLNECKKALDIYKEVYEQRKTSLGEEDPLTLSALFDLGDTYRVVKDVSNATKCFKRCLEGRRGVLGNDHEDTIAVQEALADLDKH